MKDLIVLLIHLLTTLTNPLGPGGARAVVADSLLTKQQLIVINRSRRRAPNLSALDGFLLGFWSPFLSPHHIARAAVIIKRSTLLRFHEALNKRKYQWLYSSRKKGKPGPKGPSRELIRARLANIRDAHGGDKIMYYGGGGQSNRLGGSYANPVMAALGVRYRSNAPAQERGGLPWTSERTLGGNWHSDFDHCEVAMIVGIHMRDIWSCSFTHLAPIRCSAGNAADLCFRDS